MSSKILPILIDIAKIYAFGSSQERTTSVRMLKLLYLTDRLLSEREKRMGVLAGQIAERMLGLRTEVPGEETLESNAQALGISIEEINQAIRQAISEHSAGKE